MVPPSRGALGSPVLARIGILYTFRLVFRGELNESLFSKLRWSE